jgi:hypothetical protein
MIAGNIQGCQMVCFQTKNPNLGKFWRALDWKKLILWPFGIFYGYLVNFVFIWYILSRFGNMYQEKSGNPGNITVARRLRRTVVRKLNFGEQIQYVTTGLVPFLDT